jgi:hypothetical protein
MSALLDLLIYGLREVQDEGTAQTLRSKLNFVGAGVTVTDDAVNGRTIVTIPGGGGSTPTGTGFRHVTAGAEDAASKLVDTADVNDNQITNAKLRDSGACSVIGRAPNSSGDPADISATTNNTVLKRSGDALSFATIVNADVDPAAAIAGTKISPDFGAQTITTTGNMLVGATPRASAGLFRCPKGFILAARNTADSNNNYALEDDGATDTLYVGGHTLRYAYAILHGANQWLGGYGPRISEATGNTSWQPWNDINIQASGGSDPSTNPSSGFRLFGKTSTHQASVRGKGGAHTMIASSGTGSVTGQSTWLKRERGFLRTTDATPNQVICSLAIPSGFGGAATITITSRNVSTGAVASTRIVHTVKNLSGTSSTVGNNTYHAHTADLAVTYSVNINDTNDTIEARVTGIAGTTIDHTAEIEFLEN